jgi:hypothetical protein
MGDAYPDTAGSRNSIPGWSFFINDSCALDISVGIRLLFTFVGT